MAGDWIKMRTDLYRDPKVCVMADLLMDEGSELSRFVNQQMQRDMCVTRNVMRNVTVGALLSIWGVMRTRGKRRESDLLVHGCSVAVLDDIADLPGFGDAMEFVGWVFKDADSIVFPRFFEEHNVDPTEQIRANNAERQRRFRAKNDKEKSNVTVTLRNATEKRREEKSIVLGKPNTKTPAALTVDELVADGLQRGTAEEWLAHRKRRRAPMTPIAWSGIKKEATKAGMSIEDAVCEALKKGWQSFDASWVRNGKSAQLDLAAAGSKPWRKGEPEQPNHELIPLDD